MDGSPDVRINRRKAIRRLDPGVHSACCGPNMFKPVAGCATVQINRRDAIRIGDPTAHCGGVGKVKSGSGDVKVER